MPRAQRKKPRAARSAWLERLKDLPHAPGVYVMKDDAGDVVYVGKARDLHSRVRQYFQEGTSDYRAFIGLLGGILADVETVVTRSEKEALLLEREMIRRHEPRFNVIWKDDKQYLCLRVDPSHEYPWVQVVRNIGKDGAKYFGPYHSASAARQTLRVVNRHFQLRTCRDSVLYNRNRPCLEYQIGRCPAPCVFDIDKEAYKENVDDVLMFLDGKGDQLAKRLEHRMWDAAERTDYEVAGHYRDQLRAVQKTLQKQNVAMANLVDQDVLGVYREGDDVGVAIVEVRGGRAQNITTNLFEGTSMNDEDLLETTILLRYDGEDALVPNDVLVPIPLESADALAELLTEKRKKKVRVYAPQRGDGVKLVGLARENAEHGFHEQRRKNGALERTLTGLRKKLRLSKMPARIECYDISNYQGEGIVASRVVFVGAQPAKSLYRRYRIKTTRTQDDFASMYEVLSRRLVRGQAERDLPDLIVVDGGKGQLASARAALKDAGVTDVDVVALAKSRLRSNDRRTKASSASTASRSDESARAEASRRGASPSHPESTSAEASSPVAPPSPAEPIPPSPSHPESTSAEASSPVEPPSPAEPIPPSPSHPEPTTPAEPIPPSPSHPEPTTPAEPIPPSPSHPEPMTPDEPGHPEPTPGYPDPSPPSPAHPDPSPPSPGHPDPSPPSPGHPDPSPPSRGHPDPSPPSPGHPDPAPSPGRSDPSSPGYPDPSPSSPGHPDPSPSPGHSDPSPSPGRSDPSSPGRPDPSPESPGHPDPSPESPGHAERGAPTARAPGAAKTMKSPDFEATPTATSASASEELDPDDAPSVRSAERVFTVGAKDPVVLPQTSPEILLLARIRDEAHRFAITYQRNVRQKSRLRSSLDDIAGIGPAKKRALLAHLGSLARVKRASQDEIAAVPGIGKKAARDVFRALHPGEVPPPSIEVPERD